MYQYIYVIEERFDPAGKSVDLPLNLLAYKFVGTPEAVLSVIGVPIRNGVNKKKFSFYIHVF